MLRPITQIRDGLFSLLYPTPCQVCGELVESYSDGVACALCWKNNRSWTKISALNAVLDFWISQTPTRLQSGFAIDVKILTFRRPDSCGLYNGALRASVLFLKTKPYICSRIRLLIRETYRRSEALHSANVIIPIPLHPSRQKERGFNQAEIIAGQFARASKLPVERWTLKRLKSTDRHRAGLDSQDRSRDMKKAFSVAKQSGIEQKTILLVDDIFTTGATLNECTSVLKKAGAADVKVFTLARVL